ncbi:MAG: HU family DNA-binding protein [Firmicutes bacterium]|nr:HU family DNA-binding protein [Bacillota bacterium]
MNKTELIAAVAEQTGVKKKDTEAVIKAMLDTIQSELTKKNGKVQLVGFGTFEVRERAARNGRNPQKPEEVVSIPASKAPAFKAGKAFKEFINK